MAAKRHERILGCRRRTDVAVTVSSTASGHCGHGSGPKGGPSPRPIGAVRFDPLRTVRRSVIGRLSGRSVEGGMEIHRPKSWHGLRELAKEIGVIVIGVLLALGGEQLVEALHRGEQARLAERAMRLELA